MPPAEKFRIALIQISCDLDPNHNLAKTEWKIREAAAGGAQIVCTQELFRSQYFCREENHDLFALAEAIPGPTTHALGKLARVSCRYNVVQAARPSSLSPLALGNAARAAVAANSPPRSRCRGL